MTEAQLLKAKLDKADLGGSTLTDVSAIGAIWNRAVCPNGAVATTDC